MSKEFEELKETKAVIQSGTSAIHLSGDDYNRIDEFIEQLTFALGFTESEEKQVMGQNGPETQTEEKARIVEWNYGYGQVDFFTRAKIGSDEEKMPFPKFLETYKDRRHAEKRIILVRNARHVLEGEFNRENLAQLQQTIVHLKKKLPGKAVLIYCDERRFIPDELSSLVYYLDIKPPSREELTKIALEFMAKKGLPEDSNLVHKLSSMCVGMNEDSFTQILNKAALETNFADTVIPLAEKTKKQFVDKSGLLKFVDVAVDINSVGGLDYLKWWLNQEKKAFENPEDAEKLGIKPAKGILLVGMPGCGKSLTSKAVAAFFRLPLLQLDLGSLMGKYVGESEENLRRALRLADNSSPCVLWVDEIEKAFAGVGGDESGVSQRLFGYLLTWLNDKTARVFVMATANDVAVLPPEFLRRGRFDEIFYVDFPSAPERKEIFKIHLGKAFGGKEKVEEVLARNENLRKKFENLTRDRTPNETGSDTDAVVNNIEQMLSKSEFYKKQLAERIGKEKVDEILGDPNSAMKMKFEELIRGIKPEEKEGKDGKPVDQGKKVIDYPGTEGYAGSDIESLVNAAIKRAWNQGKDIKADIFDTLLEERVHMTPLKEVLAEKIKINREKFGQYKLTSASETETNLRRFQIDSDGSDEEAKIAIAKDKRCPVDILMKLSKKGSKKVKLAILENLYCPTMCIVDLMEDKDADVKAKAQEKHLVTTPEGIIKIEQKGTKEQKNDLLSREIPRETLLSLAKDVRCPPDFLIKRAKKDTKEVKLAVLDHPNFPSLSFMDFMADADADVKAKAEKNWLASAHGIGTIKIAQNGTRKDIDGMILQRSFIPEPVWAALIGRARKDQEIKTLLLGYQNLPEGKKAQLNSKP